MKILAIFALVSIAAAKPKPGGLYSGWDHGLTSSVSVVQQPVAQHVVAQPVVQAAPVYQSVAQPVVHAAPVYQSVAQPVVHAPVAIAKPAATSYASFQQIVHPVSVAQPVVHAAPVVTQQVVAQPVVHAAPVYQSVAQPVVHAAPVYQSVAQPVQKYVSVGSYGSYGHGW